MHILNSHSPRFTPPVAYFVSTTVKSPKVSTSHILHSASFILNKKTALSRKQISARLMFSGTMFPATDIPPKQDWTSLNCPSRLPFGQDGSEDNSNRDLLVSYCA